MKPDPHAPHRPCSPVRRVTSLLTPVRRAAPATGRVTARAALLAAALALTGPGPQAAPTTPGSDAEIVQRLPARPDAAARQLRAALARDPQRLPLALASARAAIERARQHGDPRELGQAQAALAPWWHQSAPPAAVRLLRASIRQSEHAFEASLTDLDALVADPQAPLAVQAQAGLTRAGVLQVMGRLDEAAQACQALRAARFDALGAGLAVPAQACLAELRSLRGEPREGAAALAALARAAPADPWLALLRAELAERQGDERAAAALFRLAAPPGAAVYALAAHADWLLARGQARQALDLLASGDAEADALLLRRAIAWKRLGAPQAASAAATLGARLAAARQRGESTHAREEARLALDVLEQPGRALTLARENWARQKEPADAVLLARAALAAGQPQAAAAVQALVRDQAWSDVRLAGLAHGGRP